MRILDMLIIFMLFKYRKNIRIVIETGVRVRRFLFI